MFRKVAILLSTFYFLLSTQVNGQHADCDNMFILKDTIYQSEAITGFGNKKEFDGNELENTKAFEKEENSIWYFINVPTDGVFTFDIITENENDDWDFLLYEYKKNFCKRMEDQKIVPIRTNLSRSPITGLSASATENFVGAGVNANYSKPITVSKGSRYVLVVNNPKRAGGTHQLVLHFPQEKKAAVVVEEVKEVEKVTTTFKLSIKDALTQQSLIGNVGITGIQSKEVELDGISNYEVEIVKKNHEVEVNAHAKGYMLTSKSFSITKNQVIYETEVLLEKIESGKRVNLKNIQFYGNRFDFLPSAKSSLNSLLSFMTQNPKVVIEVEGHVNGPGKKNSKSYQELSYNRAYAVKDFLITNGVDKERIDFKGYGNSKMLYPNPKSSYQESANRRVEIKIISNEYHSGTRDLH